RYLLIIISGLFCFPLMAQAPFSYRNDKWELSFFTGSSHRGDDIYVTPLEGGGTRDVGLRFASGYLIGGRITENLGQHFGAELDYSLSNQPVQFRNLAPLIPAVNFDHRVHSIAYTVLFYGLKRKNRIRPYAAIGPGISLYDSFGDLEGVAATKGLTLKDRWKAAFIVGGGVKFRVGEQVGLRFDVRDHITGVPDFGFPERGTAQDPGFRPEGQLHNWQFGVGVFYSFSGR
ncbi:MAG TPA: outer membrane beta-barrel protein, partial [Acidobacteriota bacterium]|nr:outer membrane beta-barrel protein [Acidobacteriota bacterium]